MLQEAAMSPALFAIRLVESQGLSKLRIAGNLLRC